MDLYSLNMTSGLLYRMFLPSIKTLVQCIVTAILERLSGTITIFDTLCKRSMNFVQKCLHPENVLVNFVSRHAVFSSRMLSGMGRNVQFYCERFGTSLYDAVTLVKR